jgi:hypothetical protein
MSSDVPEEIKPALEAMVKMVEQWCHTEADIAGEPWMDSGCYSANAAAMQVLAKHGLMSIKFEFGRRVIAKWTESARDFGADWDFSRFKKAQAKTQKGPSSDSKGATEG